MAQQPAAIDRWTQRLEEPHGRIADRFARLEARERVKCYLLGLLGKIERKNGWQLAEAIGEKDPQGLQRLLNSARWESDEVRAPTVPEVRRLVLAMAAPEGRRRFLLRWSAWRRAHQAVAARCRKASLAAKRATRQALGTGGPLKVATIPSEEAHLTEEQWDLVHSLLPPQRGGIGRPPNDHRIVLGGILGVARAGCSWREMPEEYGDFTTAYGRWRAWKERGLWQRILGVLGWEELPGPATKAFN